MPDYSQADAPDEKVDEKSSSDEKLIAEARARFEAASEAESDFRKEALEDLEFVSGEQWPAEIKNERFLDQRPCLVLNRLPQYIHQITNDQRQNRSAIKVSPTDGGATKEIAKVLQGIVRHTEYASNADFAYDTATEYQVRCGKGFFRIGTRYVSERSFDQELYFQRIPNPLSVYMDPSSREPDGSDMNWCFITEDMTPDEFRRAFPGSRVSTASEFEALGNLAEGWVSSDRVRIAEYFYKEYEAKKLHLLTTGTVVFDEDLPRKKDGEHDLPDGVSVRQSRDVQVEIVKWAKVNGFEVLERGEWPGCYIPVIPVLGEEIEVNGKRIISGLVRNARDAQRMYNYWASAETEAIALAPRAPFVGMEGQFEGHEEKWRTANRRNHPYLEFKGKSLNGQPAPPPQRQQFEPAVQAISMARGQADNDIKACTGIYDSSLGNKSNEQTGVAIQRRNIQSQTANFHYIDNLNRSIRHAGRVLVDAIPKVYDTARAVRILHPDGQEEMVEINKLFQKDGKTQGYYLAKGSYDVVMESGPSYATKRQEAVASMIDLARSMPQLSQVAPDLIVKAMDWEGAQDIADRLKKTLPPALQDDGKNKPLPPQAVQQLQSQAAMIQTLSKQLHGALDILEKKKLELDSRERIENRKLQVAAEIELARLSSKEGTALLEAQIAQIQHELGLQHEATLAGFEHGMNASDPSQDSSPAGPDGAAQGDSPTGGQAPGSSMGDM